ncbi:MAG: GTPase domain-containing protein [Deltaproteobacteria bacterium]|nr:GTPase domain-containing protein [Deltaproteobacteria bacterium]
MAFIDVKKGQLQCKIVYYGTGLGGKTTNLRFLHKETDPKKRGKLLSLETETERTLFFDFVPISMGKIKGLETRFSFYTVPGQSFYNLTRRAILKQVDGIVFVSDSQVSRMEANIDSILNLEENLQTYGIQLKSVPHVIQYNKRDLEDTVSVDEMRNELNRYHVPDFEAVAIKGEGVIEAMGMIVKMVTEKVVFDLKL